MCIYIYIQQIQSQKNGGRKKPREKYGTRELIPKKKIDHKNIQHQRPEKREVAEKTNKHQNNKYSREFNNCRGRNRVHDVGHGKNGGDDDGDPTQSDASWGESCKSQENQVWQLQATPMVKMGWNERKQREWVQLREED